eukprot:TRINITY_DN61275_c0_g1_i2.p1 TRINITY_DN61275_c0_g1~~TRINITY_DN61275_c0_g1_i2.p1  ORF type:complete len:182 (-),score=5.82 TRINITY_DN61275_c0_g1_i2:97-642(-)
MNKPEVTPSHVCQCTGVANYLVVSQAEDTNRPTKAKSLSMNTTSIRSKSADPPAVFTYPVDGRSGVDKYSLNTKRNPKSDTAVVTSTDSLLCPPHDDARSDLIKEVMLNAMKLFNEWYMNTMNFSRLSLRIGSDGLSSKQSIDLAFSSHAVLLLRLCDRNDCTGQSPSGREDDEKGGQVIN